MDLKNQRNILKSTLIGANLLYELRVQFSIKNVFRKFKLTCKSRQISLHPNY
jgi:hypothetical protein